MYEVFYDLRAEPFRLSPDHRFCYEHSGYAKARAYMAYALKRAEGFVMITGRPGTGKTTLIGELVEDLTDEDVTTANLVCTQLQADDLLRTVAYSFDIGSSNADKAELLQRINVMLNRWHREGRRALLVVDEAQDLSISAMEELRLLTNIQVGGQPLLQIFLLGQPELRDLILSPELEQVHQRIVAASHLEGLKEDEAEAYVLHRLQVVGWQGDPAIDRRIFPLIHKFSEGVPRRINLICSRLFLLGCVEERHEIGPDDVRVVIQELQAESLAAGSWHTEQEFADTGEPDWVTVPGQTDAGPGEDDEPVQLRAVASEEFAPADNAANREDVVAKKKELAPVTPLNPVSQPEPEPEPEPEPALSESPASVDFEQQGENELFLPPVGQEQGETPVSTPLVPETPVTRSRERRDTAQLPPRVVSAASPARGHVPPARFSRLLVVLAIVVALGLAGLFFFELYVGRDDDWSVSQVPPAAVPQPEPAPEEEPPLPELEKLPSEKWEEQGDLIFWEDDNSASLSARPSAEPPAESLEADAPQDISRAVLPGSALPDTVATDIGDGSVAIEEAAAPGREGEVDVADGEPLISMLREEAAGSAYSVGFAFDSIILTTQSRVVLDDVVVRMQESPRLIATLAGFADYQGDEAYNLVLSRQRADAVREYLVAAGVSSARLRVDGRGAQAERDSGATQGARQLRVVEINLVESSAMKQ